MRENGVIRNAQMKITKGRKNMEEGARHGDICL
jgi:hypothetical protein